MLRSRYTLCLPIIMVLLHICSMARSAENKTNTTQTATGTGTSTQVGQSPESPKTQDPLEILKESDEIRSPSGSFRMKVAVESPGEETYEFEIQIGGKDASLIKTLLPKREIGKNFLMLDADMWAYLPNLRRAVRVTLNQKLTGQAVNGDIGRMRWYGDYKATIESQNQDQWTLFLTATRSGLTYDQIRLWIDKKNFHPIKGEYLTKTGKPLKRITFLEYRYLAGALRPVAMLIENIQKPSERSTLKILEMESAQFPAQHFTQANLQ